MADAAKTIAGLTPTIMSAGLLKRNLEYLKKKKKKSLIGLGTENIVGTSLIQATAQAGNW